MGDGDGTGGRWTGVGQLAKDFCLNRKTISRVICRTTWPSKGTLRIWNLLRTAETVTKNGRTFAELMPEKYEMKPELMAYPFVMQLAKMTGRSPSFVDKVLRHQVWATEKSKAVWQMACDIYGVEIAAREGERFGHDYVEWKKQKPEGAQKWKKQ